MKQILKDAKLERLPHPLHLVWKPSAHAWELLADFTYRAECGRTVTAKAGFFTDLGSVPWYGRWLISKTECPEAFVVHDWALVKRQWDNGEGMSIAEADGLLKEIAIYTGYSRWRVLPMYWIVRVHSITVKD